MELNVLYFAHVRERIGRTSETLTCPDGATVREVMDLLGERHPELGPLMRSVRAAVNGEFAAPDEEVPPGAEFVLIPPVSGGAGTPPVDLTDAPLDDARLKLLTERVSDPAHGSVVTFQGVVRDHARGHAVTRLYYEAYERMALSKLREIAAEVEADFPGARVAVHHRTGTLEVGDVAVLIAVGSAHRAEGFGACRRVIDRIKEDVPIWKREVGPDGEEWVSPRP
ncbi:MAG: molybdenum cofactor biosynthesis protein MoaE [Myxococcota bacterium]